MDTPTTVLYVDDNPKSNRLLTSVLEDSGFRVISKYDPVEALALCRRTSFDLILLDYEMPKMTGAELSREIKYLMPDLPVVLISGRTHMPQEELEFVDAHFGFGTVLDDLLWTMRILTPPKVVTLSGLPGGLPTGLPSGLPTKDRIAHHGSRYRPHTGQDHATEARWADST